MVMVEPAPPEVTDCGLKETSAPDGAPVAERATVWATPLVTALETVDVAAAPAVTVPEVGEAAMEKSLATTAFTVRENEVVWVAEAPVPVTVIGVVPAGVAPVVDTVMVELPPAVTDVELKVTVVPDGAPLALRLTVWATPLVTAVETVDVAAAPAVTVPEVGEAAMEKSLATTAFTVRENEVVWVAEAPVPVTVIAVVPAGVAPVVDTVMVALTPAVTQVGLKVTVVPDGAPLALRLTVWATPLVTAVETVDVVLEPAVTVPEVGEAAMEKSLATTA